MSDAAAPAAPVAPAAAEPTQAAAPPPAPVEVDPYAEFDNILKTKPVKYKAGGKEKQATSMKELLRKAEMADGLQSRAQELSEREAKAAAIMERDTRLRSAKTPKERIAILREMAGEGFDEAAEEAILERIEREKSLSGLSQTERQAREEAAELKARLAAYEEQESKSKEEAQRAQDEADERQLGDTLATIAVKALTKAGLPREAAPDAGRRLAALMFRAEKLKLPLEPDELADKAVEMAGRDMQAYTSKLEGETLLSFVGEATARRISRAWLAKMGQGAAASAPPPQKQPAPAEKPVRESPITAWKKFGL